MTEAWVSRHVECAPLAETSDGEDPVAPPLEPLHAGVAALHHPAGLPTLAVVRARLPPPLARPQNALELGPRRTRLTAASPNVAFLKISGTSQSHA